MNKAFTLIELLVVVLIIGILSAIALPQYTKAVGKARVTEAVITMKSLMDAEEIYHMANGDFTSDLSELDITIPTSGNYTYKCHETPFSGACGAVPQKEGLPVLEFYPTNSSSIYAGKRWCQAYDVTMSAAGKAKAVEICKTFGPQDTSITHGEYHLVQ